MNKQSRHLKIMSNQHFFLKQHLKWILFLCFLTACGPSETPTQPPSTNTIQNTPLANESYPAPQEELAYPAQGEALATTQPEIGYPPVEEEGTPLTSPRFQFDTVLQAGQTAINGYAPPNLSLAILDITFNGVILGLGLSDENGRFEINVSSLPEGHRIGITIGELPPGKTMSDISNELYPYRGDGFMNVPNLGIFFETALVQP